MTDRTLLGKVLTALTRLAYRHHDLELTEVKSLLTEIDAHLQRPEAPEGAQPVASLVRRAMGHPIVLEIMADCADVVDTESSAQHDPDLDGPYDGEKWVAAARDLRVRAQAIRAEDPELWATPQPTPKPLDDYTHVPPKPVGTVTATFEHVGEMKPRALDEPEGVAALARIAELDALMVEQIHQMDTDTVPEPDAETLALARQAVAAIDRRATPQPAVSDDARRLAALDDQAVRDRLDFNARIGWSALTASGDWRDFPSAADAIDAALAKGSSHE